MLKPFETHRVSLAANNHARWTVKSAGLMELEECSEVELENEIEKLEALGWYLVGYINHRPKGGAPQKRDLYFRREIAESSRTVE